MKNLRIFALFAGLLVSANMAIGQTAFTAYMGEILTTTCPGSDLNFDASNFQDLPAGVTFSGLSRNNVTCNSAGSHYRSANFNSTTKAAAIAADQYVTWSFTTNSSVSLTISEASLRHERSGSGANNGALYYSIGGGPFSQVGSDFTINTGNTRTVFDFGTPVAVSTNSDITFRWFCWATSTTGGGNTRFKGGTDYATGSGIVGTYSVSASPAVDVIGTFDDFYYAFNDGPSNAQTFNVSGINLTNPITISVSSNYEISDNAFGPFSTADITLFPVMGTVPSTDIYVRMAGALAAGTYGGTVTVSSDDPTSPVSLSLNGNVVSETLPYFEDFGATAGLFPLGWIKSGIGGDNWSIQDNTNSTGSGFANLADDGSITNEEAIITCNRAISTVGHTSVRISFLARKTGSYSGNVLFDYSTDGILWNNVPFTDVPNTSEWGLVFFTLPVDAAGVDNLRLRFRTTRTNTSGNYRIDDFAVLPPGIEVNLSASAAGGSEDTEDVITITATTASPVLADETIMLAVSGSSINDADYTLSNTSITILAGNTTGSVDFTIVDDNINETNEVAQVAITSVSFELEIGASGSVDINITENADDAIYLTSINTASPTVTFDELQNFGTNLSGLTAGFYSFEQGSNANDVYRADDGFSTTGDTYSYGDDFSTERALGSITTGPLSPNVFGAKIVNNTGVNLDGFQVAYTGEQWRSGAASFDEIRFSYSTDATALSNGTWTEVSDLHFVAPINGGNTGLDGNDPANQESFDVMIGNLNIIAGQEFWIRWTDVDVAGQDHGMAVDDLSITPFVTTALNNASCGATDVTMNQLVNASTVSGALQYRFRITGTNSQSWPSDQFVYTSNSKNFRFQFIPGALLGETYSVEVALSLDASVFGPYGNPCNVTLQSLASAPLSVVNPLICGSTVSMDEFINTAWVPGATAYRFQIVGANAAGWPANTYVQETTAPIRKFRFIEIPGALFGETYAVAVAYQDASGNWTAYGASCNITVETPSTQLEVGDCGAVGVLNTDFLRADNVVGASGYRFRITGANSAGWVMDQTTVDRSNRVFWMNLADGWLPGETYTIEVAVQDAAGNYGAYGSPCSVTMAGTPSLAIVNVDAAVQTKATIEGEFVATASRNPFTRDFALNLVNANDNDAINVAIYDMSGKLIEASSVNPMDIESARFGANLATGMYMIQVTQGANQAVIRQIKQ